MLGKAPSINGGSAPPGPNVLLYVGPHSMTNPQTTKGSSLEETRQIIPQCVNSERKLNMKDESIRNIDLMQYSSTFNGVSVNKNATHVHNIMPVDNGLPIPPGFTCKPVVETVNTNNSVNCGPGGINNSFIGVQNVVESQRIIQTDSCPHTIKVIEKSANNPGIPNNICAENFAEQNQNNANMMAISQNDERLESDAGESCSSMSSGDSQSDGSGNILIMSGQMPPSAINAQQNSNQILLNSNNSNIIGRGPPGNILISNMGSQMDGGNQNIPSNFHVMNQAMIQQQMINQGMSVVNNQPNICVRSDQVQQTSGSRDDSVCFDSNSVVSGDVRQGIDGEIVIVNNVAHHVVRTPGGGFVLGVLPRTRQVQGQCAPGPVSGGANMLNPDNTNCIGVPLGWARLLQGNNICYISPSGAILCTLDQVREYLQSAGTCKCGLDCPLRPEAVFNFDPKVMSKPTEMRSGLKLGEMWRGCAGKRRAGPPCSPSPSPTPPSPACPEDKKQTNVDGDLPTAKKRKRKGNPYSNVSVSQLLAQRENMQHQQNVHNQMQLQQFPQQQVFPNNVNIHQHPEVQQNAWIHPHNMNSNVPHPCESASPTVARMRFNNTQDFCAINKTMNFPTTNSKNMRFHGLQQMVSKPDDMSSSTAPVEIQINGKNQLGSQVLSVSGNSQGCVLQDQRSLQQQIMINTNQQQNIQLTGVNHVLGQNGQIISIQGPNLSRSQSLGSITTNDIRNKACSDSDDIPKSDQGPVVNKICDITREGDRNPNSIQILSNGLVVPSSQSQPLNPSNNNTVGVAELHNLPPEVIEKINQQQQIFIQQNQKQMELAMKSIKTHIVPGNPNTSTLEVKANQSEMQINQMVVANSMLMSNNQRVPPWQLNRLNTMQQVNQPNRPIQNINKHNQQPTHLQCNNNAQQNNGNQSPHKNMIINNVNDFSGPRGASENIYSRVPPLHHDTPPAMWSEQELKKKTKAKGNKKPKCHESNQHNINKTNQPITVTPMNHSPSCIEDPSGYLAQQAAYMSRQLGMVHNMMNPCDDIKSNEVFNNKNNSKSFNSRNNNTNTNGPKNLQHTMLRNSPSQSNLPDSSVNCDKSAESDKHSHCQGCIAEMNESKNNRALPYQTKIKNYIDSLPSVKSESMSQPGTPSPNQCTDDNPVTSSTYGERPGSRSNNFSGPIQGRIISTSNGSPMEGYQLPELSPTPSNSSRNTDTPQSKSSNSGFNISSSCPYSNSSPAYSYQGSSRESVNSNPPTPSPGNVNQNYSSYSSPEPMPTGNNQTSLSSKTDVGNNRDSGNMQMNNTNIFSNSDSRGNIENECPSVQISSSSFMLPLSHSQRIQPNQNGPFTFFMSSSGVQNLPDLPISNEIVTTVTGHTLSRNTITSVLAGKAQTATTSINGSASGMPQLYPPVGNSSAIIHNNSSLRNSNLPSNYPMHIAGSVVQTLVTKTPLEMVQNVVSNIRASQPLSTSQANMNANNVQEKHVHNSGQVIMNGSNQILLNASGHGSVMAPPPPKSQASDTPTSTSTTNTSIAQSIPTVGGVPQVINHPTVLVNTIPAPFMLQPQVVTVDGQVVNQNVGGVPQIVAGNIIPQGSIIDGSNSSKSPGMVNRPALLSPDNGKKKGKKRKPSSPVTSVMQLPTQHNSGNLLVQHNMQQSQQYVSQGFQVSPNGNISTTPMLQALTIVPGKGGAPAHIVMNGQAAGNFGSQQIINSQGTQHINLLQPVNLLNGPTGVVQNFPTFQQFIVPGLGGMVMTSDGTAILQDPSSMPMQLQIQNVNGQNVLTPVQNQGILTAGPAGMVIRTQNPNNKMMQSQHSPGAQFLSPSGGQIVMGGSPFNGQLSPLIANVSPNQTVAFNNSPPQVRSNMQQEFLQCNQMGQTLMLPVSPNQIAVSSSSNQQNATYVQQNTTIVQQQTTMVANNQNQFQNVSRNSQNNQTPLLNVEHGIIVNQTNKQSNQMKEKIQNNNMSPQIQQMSVQTSGDGSGMKRLAVPFTQVMGQSSQINTEAKNNDIQIQQQVFQNFNQNNMLNQQDMNNMMNPHYRNTVSTQTLANQQQNGNKSPNQPYSNQSSGASPPDTTTHSPLGSLDGPSGSPANSLSGRSPNSTHGNQVDTTTASPEPLESNSSGMVQCVSSSEPDSMDTSNWGKHREKSMDMQVDTIHQNNASPQRQNFYNVDSSGIHFNNQTITVSSLNNQQNLTITPANYYEKSNNITKHNINPNTISIIPTNNMELSSMQGNERNKNINKPQHNYYQSEKAQLQSISNLNQMNMQRSMENMNNSYNRRLSTIPGTDECPMEDKAVPTTQANHQPDIQSRQFKEGDLVWGPAKGYPAWPGKLITKNTINGKEDGKVLVRWFGGDKCLTVLDSSNLQTLSEGLEAHHAARTKCRKSRKLNSQLEKAIQEAMAELDRITETKELYNEIKSDEMLVEDADINGNSSKSLMKNVTRNNSKTVSEFVSKNESKTKWSNKKESKTRTGSSVVKIAPHPGSVSSNIPAQPSGRLRSSHR